MSQMKMGDNRKIEGAVDSISNLPDEILQQHILCFIPTKISISTSLLSRRWRHVWCEVHSISLDVDTLTAASVNETLNRYAAPKTKNFHLRIKPITENKPYIDRWIKWAMSHNVESLSLDLCFSHFKYELPDFFFNSSSVKQLKINLQFYHMIVLQPECTISWTSLQKLSLTSCSLSNESMAKILSGCPVLENLTFDYWNELNVLDLSKSLRLRTLELQRDEWYQGPRQIVAPHIHCLRLHDSGLSCTLVDVSSLAEANLEISCVSDRYTDRIYDLETMGLKMLEKLHNVEKLTFGGNFIQLLSLAEIRGPVPILWGGAPFPILKVKALTLDINICQYVIPGIERLLQNSPDLEKLKVRGRTRFQVPEEFAGNYLKLRGFNVNKCWRSKDGVSWNKCCEDLKSEHVSSLVELVLKNTEKLDKMVVLLDERYLNFKIEDVVVPTLPRNKSVNVVLSNTKLMGSDSEEW
ncbi:unnamed protein product [Eruca vesicaria subsp. sativa]|uniref:F-box domain-containing protein n=1 Tax=Eruca vesicaria subsp. sativa TaxID=29727 RepID=A0ABC8L3I1_ERUVS|nr:unnamed protein product [Eruca vesicaria subsp. sativa]